MKKILSITLALLLIVSMAQAQNELSKVGTGMAQFLKLPIGARGAALGEAYAAATNDVTAMYWNPAGMQNIGGYAFGISRNQLFADITLNYIALAIPFGQNTTLGFSVIALNSGDIEVTTVDAPDGTGEFYNTSNVAAGISFSRRLTERFVLGFTVKYVQERLYHEKASTIAFDIGSQFDTGIYGVRLGMALTNFGGKMQLDGPDLDVEYTNPETGFTQPSGARLQTQEWPIPLTYRLGIMMDMIGPHSEIMHNEHHRVTAMLEGNDPVDYYLRYNLGLEYEWNGLLALRAGYKINYDKDLRELANKSYPNYSLGAGLRLNMGGTLLQLDYAFSNYGLLDYVHQYTLLFSF